MADNTTLGVSTGGDVIRDIDRSGVKTQLFGLDLAPGAATEVLAGKVTSLALTATSGFAVIANGAFSASSPSANSSIAASVASCGMVGLAMSNTNFVGTLAFEATGDGTNWFPIDVLPQGQNTFVQSIALGTGVHFQALAGCSGFQQVRIRAAPWTSGSGTAYITPSVGASDSASGLTVTRLGGGHTATRTSVTSTVTNGTTLLAANVLRIGATVYNESTAILYLALGSAGTTTDYTAQLQAGAFYEVPYGFDGLINGVWQSANGFARITELT